MIKPPASEGASTDIGGRRVAVGRVVAAGGVGFGAVALVYPQAAFATAAGFALLLAVSLLPRRAGRRLREAPDSHRRQVLLWPDAGSKAVVEAMSEPAFLIDRNMMLRYRNAAAERAFGNMVLGDPIALRFRSPELLASVEAALAQAAAGTAVLQERRPSDRSWSVQIVPLPAVRGEKPSFFLMLFRDKTGETRIERMRTDFVANASHELRTPLASLIGFVETLQGPARDDAAARARFLAIMAEQAARMSRLIDDLLSLSRIEMKRHVAFTGQADLAQVMAEVRELMAPLARELGIAIEFDRPDEAFLVDGEHDELIQVFSNLVENACKYGESGKRVVLELARSSGRVEAAIDASVRDFGPGIAPEHLPRLTERFYRVDAGNSRIKRGTGLGLSIVRNILLRHQARLIIASVPGEGSTFTARFPSRAANNTEPVIRESPQ